LKQTLLIKIYYYRGRHIYHHDCISSPARWRCCWLFWRISFLDESVKAVTGLFFLQEFLHQMLWAPQLFTSQTRSVFVTTLSYLVIFPSQQCAISLQTVFH